MWLVSSSVNLLRMRGWSRGAFFKPILCGPGSSFGYEVAAFTWSSAKHNNALNLAASG